MSRSPGGDAPYVDAIAIQPPFHASFPKAKFDEIYKATGKPIILCDFAIRFNDGDKDIRSWKPEKDSVAAGKAYVDYVKAAMAMDYIVGVFWCNPVDTPRGFGKPGSSKASSATDSPNALGYTKP